MADEPDRMVLHYRFEAGSGVCLWAGNDAARATFDYAVDHEQLPLSENARRFLDYLIAWFDTSLDWDDPTMPAAGWTAAMATRFRAGGDEGLGMLLRELDANRFSVIDRRDDSAAMPEARR
ncbi:MAG: hypothetical protein JNM13_04130 [Hyphomicrobiaceae bacterium]|nr:hypothetical protein [Hyphomicrobiaceae bacterium]